MQVIQIVYLSLFALDDLNPCFTALKNMWFVNGFSYYSLTKDHLIDPHTPNKIKSLRFYSRFMENYNLTFLLILIPYFASFVCYIISKICFKNNLRLKNRINKTSKRLACYYAFNGVMFSAYIVVVSLVLEAMYGVKLINGIIGNISLVQMIFLLAIYLVNFVLIIYVPRYFG
jgi:hypothetical protein